MLYYIITLGSIVTTITYIKFKKKLIKDDLQITEYTEYTEYTDLWSDVWDSD